MGLTQEQMAVLLGITKGYVWSIEKGEKVPSKKVVSKLESLEKESHRVQESANAAGISARSLFSLARENKKMSVKDLAQATGYGVGYIQALEGGARLSEKFARVVAPVLGVEAEDLMAGSDHPPITGETAGAVGAKPNVNVIGDISVRYVPLISWSQAGMLTDFTDEVYDYEGHLAVDIKDPKAIAVRIRGDSMEPRFHEGDVAILSPSTIAQTGDLVIARIRDQGVVFKRFQRAGRALQFISLNPRYPMIEAQEEEIVWVYPVKSVTVNTL